MYFGGGGLITKSCLTCDSMDVACQAPLSMGFSRREYWSGLPFPSPRDLPRPMDGTQVFCTAARGFTDWAMRKAHDMYKLYKNVNNYCHCHWDISWKFREGSDYGMFWELIEFRDHVTLQQMKTKLVKLTKKRRESTLLVSVWVFATGVERGSAGSIWCHFFTEVFKE